MRISSVMPYATANSRFANPNMAAQKTTTTQSVQTTGVTDANKIMHIAFTGNPSKNINQGVSVSVEDSYIGLRMYNCGGAAGVANQLPQALNKDGMDFKHIVPYYSYGNKDGGIKMIVVPRGIEYNPNDPLPENLFISVNENTPKSVIAKNLNVSEDRIKFVVQDAPETPKDSIKAKYNIPDGMKVHPFREVIPTETKGVIQRIDENDLGKLKSIPYKVYRMVIPKGNTVDDKTVYVIHTPDMSRFQKAYSYTPELKDHPYLNLFSRDFGEAAADMLPKLNTPEHGNFNPSNIIAHCRTGFPITEAVINRSVNEPYYRGMKIVDIFHNPMENYQGVTGSPLEFLRFKATPEDYLKLSKMPEFPQLIDIDHHRHSISPEEGAVVDKVIRPFLQYFVDDKGLYNQSITPIVARALNPENVSANHVSHTFANEAIQLDDMCKGLTSFFRAADVAGDKIEGRPNGCNIDGFKVNDAKATMGRNNGLSADMSWYTPYDPKTDSAETIAKSKRANTKAFLDMVGEATEKRLDKIGDFQNAAIDDELNNLFYSKDLIEKNRYVLGGLSKFDEKDILLMGWGRSDSQKGFPITMKGMLKFLQREDIPQEWKDHFKLALGSGPDPWEMDDKGVGDFHLIKDTMSKIQELDGGRYKTNVMYGNGFFPARLVTASTYGVFTSRGEPQGLSCPEALQTATPSGSLNTGGAGEMIVTTGENAEKANGFKTTNAFMRNVKDLDWPEGTDLSKLTAQQIDERRIELASDEVADMFADMAKTYYEKPDVYKKMALNAGRSEFDWHNNQALNAGRSTLDLYKEDGFELQKGWEGRNKKPLKRLVGEFGGQFEELKRTAQKKAEEAVQTLQNPKGSKYQKAAALIILGAIVLVGGGAYVYKRNHGQNSKISKVA